MKIPEKETLRVEFKSDRNCLPDKELVEEAVGMANTEGGEIFLGVEDNGKITGIQKQHADPNGAVAMVFNKTIPSLVSRASILQDDNMEVLRIEVPISRSLTSTSDGRIMRRRLKADGTPENIPMYPYDIVSRLSEVSPFDYSASILPDVRASDLDADQRNRLRRIIRQNLGDQTLLRLSDEEFDLALGFQKHVGEQLFVTITGLLMIGNEEVIQRIFPNAKITFQYLKGTKVLRNNDYVKPLAEAIEILMNEFSLINTEDELNYGPNRIAIPQYSENAYREGLINAIVHRDYASNRRIRIVWDNQGLTINSPGGFIEGVTARNLLSVEPHGRNVLLADALKRIGWTERTGRGVDKIYEETIRNGKPAPDYSESDAVNVRLYFQKADPDYDFVEMIIRSENAGNVFYVFDLLLLKTLRDEKNLDEGQLSERLNLRPNRLHAVLDNLIQAGLIHQNKKGQWALSAASDKSQSSSFSSDKAKGQILDYIAEHGSVSRQNVMSLLGCTSNQAYSLLRKMTDQKILRMIKNGPKSSYVANTESVQPAKG